MVPQIAGFKQPWNQDWTSSYLQTRKDTKKWLSRLCTTFDLTGALMQAPGWSWRYLPERKKNCPAECWRIHVSESMWILKFYWLLPFTNETFHVSKTSTLHPAYKTIGFGLGKEHSPSILWRSDRKPLTFINNKQLIFCTSVLHYTQIIHQKSPKPISIFFLKSKRSSSKQLCYAVVYVVWK